MGCNCNSTPCTCQNVNICDPCNNTGCPIQLDWDCSLYHKSNNQISNLTNLGLTNGATLTLFAETVDTYIGQIDVPNFVLPCLRDSYTINTLAQFAQAVDTELCAMQADIDSLGDLINTSITPVDTATINITASGTLNHTIQASVNISADADNQLIAVADGLYSSPQTLSVNYGTSEVTISDGNTIDLSPLTFNVGAFLGNLASDPSSPLDGSYWFRTDLAAASGLKIRVNGTTRTITTS